MLIQIFEYTGCQLHYSQCALCGSKIEGDCHFDAMQGGAICTSCNQGKQINYSASVRLFIEHLLHLDWDNPPKFQVKGIDLINAEKILLDYIQSLIGKPFKSLTFIKQVTSLS